MSVVCVTCFFVCLGLSLLGLSCTTTDLWEEKIDAKWGVLVLEEALELCNLLSEHVWGVSDTTNDTDTAGVGDGGGELRTGGDVHAGKHDGVVDLEEVGRDRSDLFCAVVRHCTSACDACAARGAVLRGLAMVADTAVACRYVLF